MELSPEICRTIFDALEQTRETLFITDTTGIIVYANPAFEGLTGYTVVEAIGENANILKSGEHSPDFYSQMWTTIKAGGEWNGSFINKRKDGTAYLCATRISPIRGPKGEITHFLAIRHDDTREVALEEQLRQSQKMEALGLLAGQLSHDFNNLLTIIIGSMELIMEDLPKTSVSMKLTQGILQTSKESANLIKQLLIFARRQEYAPKIVNLNEIIKETQILLDRLMGTGVRMEYSLARDLVEVNLEPEQFKQAVLNMVINAKDAMPSGGSITINTFNQYLDKPPVTDMKPGDYAVMEISDTGAGIPPGAVDHIFEPFFTTKPKGKGTGLGLSAVYGIIKQHKGGIIVESKPGTGTVFRIFLPKAA
jgi:PAS domain S-box-containing protein